MNETIAEAGASDLPSGATAVGYRYACADCGTFVILPPIDGNAPPPLRWVHDEKGHHVELLAGDPVALSSE
jgi:hypothetical protein